MAFNLIAWLETKTDNAPNQSELIDEVKQLCAALNERIEVAALRYNISTEFILDNRQLNSSLDGVSFKTVAWQKIKVAISPRR